MTSAVDHDEAGTLYLTNRKLVFVGESIIDAPWSEIAKLSRNGIKLFGAAPRSGTHRWCSSVRRYSTRCSSRTSPSDACIRR